MFKNILINTSVSKLDLDAETPIGIYLKLRDLYSNTHLLECAEYQAEDHNFSYICINPIAEFKVHRDRIIVSNSNNSDIYEIKNNLEVLPLLNEFVNSFKQEVDSKYSFLANGLFGYSAFDAIKYYEDIELVAKRELDVPEILYQAFQYILAVNHQKNELYLVENKTKEEQAIYNKKISKSELLYNIYKPERVSYEFKTIGEESSNFEDDEYMDLIDKCKKHVYLGDVFQIVPSRRFKQDYQGDDFEVYRALRSINPSPYLFYFDFGSFRIIGSSPEAELIVQDNKAYVHPIAGTIPKIDDEVENQKSIQAFIDDPKENAEHVMLVDLARNDLSIHCENVKVEEYRKVEKFSHVYHFVSIVSGELQTNATACNLLADTFPAGTLSGAPKYKAIELIDKYEPSLRGIYGGAIGCLGFDNTCIHAIMIRTFLSKDHTLYRQAGGGVVADSVPVNELNEVKHKLGALRKSLEIAEGGLK